MPTRKRYSVFWGMLCGTTLVVSFFFAWWILAKVDFFYPVCHDLLKIDQVAAEYGPQNRVRTGFELTTRGERIRLFAAINRVVHHQGKGLGEIHYYGADGSDLGPMLTLWDQAHLSQVVLLLSCLKTIGWGAVALWILMIAFGVRCRLKSPPLASLIAPVLTLFAALLGIIYLIGPDRSFSMLHATLFPATQPWFLYYQESLMTLLMKAPDLFGLIALQIFLLGILVWVILINSLKFLFDTIF